MIKGLISAMLLIGRSALIHSDLDVSPPTGSRGIHP